MNPSTTGTGNLPDPFLTCGKFPARLQARHPPNFDGRETCRSLFSTPRTKLHVKAKLRKFRGFVEPTLKLPTVNRG